MEKRVIEKTGDEISSLAFGAMRLDIKKGREESKKMIRYGIDNGINLIDTAYLYGLGENEKFLSEALEDGYREKVKISTKIPAFNIRKIEECEIYLNNQLKSLKTDCIEYYFLHNIDLKILKRLEKKGIFEFLDKAKKEGKIKYAGFSYHGNISHFKEVVDLYDWDACIIQYNYFDEGIQMDIDSIKYVKSKGMGVFVMEPLKGGILAGKLPEKAEKIFKKEDPNKTNGEWGLSWILNQAEITSILSGITSYEILEENINTAKRVKINSLSKDEIDTIHKVKNIMKESLKINCTNCGYCMPCKYGVDIPRCLGIYNEKYLFEENRFTGLKHYFMQVSGIVGGKEQYASKCTQCNKCIRLCTQKLNIPEELKKVEKEFEIPGFKQILWISNHIVMPIVNKINKYKMS